MLGRLILLSLRNLRRNLLYTFIVIGGLSLGMITFLAIVQWSAWHLSSDRHFPEAENLYRISLNEKSENFERHTARILHGDLALQILQSNDIPEIEAIARLAPFRNAIVRKDELVYYEDKCFACDSTFLQLFPPEVIHGDLQSMLNGPYKMVLTRETARKYFGDENPIGQSLKLVHQFGVTPDEYEITGVIEAYPANTHFSLSILTSFDNPDNYSSTSWVYARTQDGADITKLENSLKEFLSLNNSEDYIDGIFPYMTKVTDIHLKSHLAREIELNGQFKSVIIISIAGLLVFILAWFNFTLLSVSQNQLNLKKLIFQWQMGAGKKSFFIQFLVDFLVVGIISLIISVLLGFLLANQIFATIGIQMNENIPLMLIGFSIFLILLILSSILTALFATYRLYKILKIKYLSSSTSTHKSLSGKNIFIQVVIVLEFMITFILISNLFMIREQVNYAISQQIGANDTTTIQIPNLPRPVIDKYMLFRDEIKKYPVFSEITAMMEEPGGMAMDAFYYSLDGMESDDDPLYVFPVDKYFLKFYDLGLIMGRDFPMDYNPEDTVDYFILNETAARMLSPDSYEDLLGRTLSMKFQIPNLMFPGEIIGIIEDFHLSTMEMKVNPMVIFPKHTWLYCFSLRIGGDRQEAIQILDDIWEDMFPEYPLRYYFTTEMYETIYETELTEVRILMIFSILSLLIAGTGLFALSGYFMHQKMRAAAIRKINGAGIRHILIPELKQYLVLALISTLIAAPLSYLIIKNWMSNFSYQLPIPLWIIPVSGLLLIAFSWMAVFYHSWKLARLNPAEYLGRD
jgi:putative ABC transport system permease protein